jgi:hypothetical protein
MSRRRTVTIGLAPYRSAGRVPGPEPQRYSLTPEGAAAVSRADRARSVSAACAQPAAASSGHLHCPAALGCREGRVPEGWVRSGEVAP